MAANIVGKELKIYFYMKAMEKGDSLNFSGYIKIWHLVMNFLNSFVVYKFFFSFCVLNSPFCGYEYKTNDNVTICCMKFSNRIS